MSSPCIFYEGIIHRIINYVDDSSNLVSSKNAKTLQLYMNDYFKLLEEFYNINKLVINPEKSKLLVTCKAKYRRKAESLKLVTSNYNVIQNDKIKVLGVFIT